MNDPEFLELDDVVAIHAEGLAAFGGMAGVRDEGLLASAVAMPRATFGGEYLHRDLYAMAAAYAFHIAQNQPFLDGNKRTAILSAIVFLSLNGVTVPEATEARRDDRHRRATLRQGRPSPPASTIERKRLTLRRRLQHDTLPGRSARVEGKRVRRRHRTALNAQAPLADLG